MRLINAETPRFWIQPTEPHTNAQHPAQLICLFITSHSSFFGRGFILYFLIFILYNIVLVFLLIYFLLKNDCFTEFCWFLSNLSMNPFQFSWSSFLLAVRSKPLSPSVWSSLHLRERPPSSSSGFYPQFTRKPSTPIDPDIIRDIVMDFIHKVQTEALLSTIL